MTQTVMELRTQLGRTQNLTATSFSFPAFCLLFSRHTALLSFLLYKAPIFYPGQISFWNRLDIVGPQLNLRGDLRLSLNFPNALP